MIKKEQLDKIMNLVPGQMTTAEQAIVLSTLELVLQLLNEQSVLLQEMRDEINRLKGEQGKPNISGKNQNPRTDISSEKERKTKKTNKKRQVKFDKNRQADEKKTIDIEDKSELPSDIVFKGYATTHYQSLEISAKLIELERAIYYSPSMGETYTAEFPDDYESGDYSQDLKGHIIMLKSKFGMSIPQVGDFLRMNGISISNGTVSNIYIAGGEKLKEESQAIHTNGLEGGLYGQTDTTGSRVNGVNYHTHIFGNDIFTSYFTRRHKDRQTVIDLLRSEEARVYLLNEATYDIFNYLKVPKKIQKCLLSIDIKSIINRKDFEAKIKAVLSTEDFTRHQSKILEGAYIAAYQADNPLAILVSDDAPQYKKCALQISLCWVHIGRNFKKLNPKIKYHQDLLADFLSSFWIFYHRLKNYRQNPSPEALKLLDSEFEGIFSLKTGYEQLDELIAKTKAKKDQLLVVLKHPYIPLHNNEAELAARKEVRYRDISFQTRSKKGTQAKDTFFTIIQTCHKLGINAYEYILDRMKRKPTMTSLDQMVLAKTNIAF